MAHTTWTYLADNGKNFKIGLFHGPRTGHVLIHINAKITTIDFAIRKSKVYSMFINEELIEIAINKKPNGYSYSFRVNTDVDTPGNRVRKAQQRKNRWFGVLFFTTIIVLSVLLAIISERHKKERERRKKEMIEQMLKEFGKDGKIDKEEKKEIMKKLYHN